MSRLGQQADTERGASAVEYGLLIALIAAVIVGAVIGFGQDVLGLFGIANDPAWTGN